MPGVVPPPRNLRHVRRPCAGELPRRDVRGRKVWPAGCSAPFATEGPWWRMLAIVALRQGAEPRQPRVTGAHKRRRRLGLAEVLRGALVGGSRSRAALGQPWS